jgi:hypothetical protein
MDHVVPVAKGGDHAAGNVVPACWPCNAGKGTDDLDAWLRRGQPQDVDALRERAGRASTTVFAINYDSSFPDSSNDPGSGRILGFERDLDD